MKTPGRAWFCLNLTKTHVFRGEEAFTGRQRIIAWNGYFVKVG